jgi:hypothetical protein
MAKKYHHPTNKGEDILFHWGLFYDRHRHTIMFFAGAGK